MPHEATAILSSLDAAVSPAAVAAISSSHDAAISSSHDAAISSSHAAAASSSHDAAISSSHAAATLSSRVTALFPAGVVAADLRGNADPACLHPDEMRECRDFGAKRVADFAAGRLCARRALSELGFADFALHREPDRRPRWPESIVGSISHTDGFCVAVVAKRDAFRALGVDAEQLGRAGEDLWDLLFTPTEKARLYALPAEERGTTASIAHSAKEAYYKCQFGVTGAWLDFADVEIAFDGGLSRQGAFRVTPGRHAPPLPSGAVRGRYALAGPVVLTGLAMLR
jgi:4'-phosphopantetheinyl transferase EntD